LPQIMNKIRSPFSKVSKLVDLEKTSWVKLHKLDVEPDAGKGYRALVEENFKEDLSICYVNRKICGVKYQHWFVTDGTWTIEFGTGEHPSNIKVVVHRNPKTDYVIADEFKMTQEVKDRMLQVCGATNYSLALRNCEHVARYIQSGVWVCFQMAKDSGFLYNIFKNEMSKSTKLINTPPEELKSTGFERKRIYPNYQSWYTFVKYKSVLTEADNNNQNVVFIGPTGSGKSTLINNFFNLSVVETGASAASVTRNVQFIEGKYKLYNWETGVLMGGQTINVIDTIGMCDSFFTPDQIYNMIKTNIELNLAKIDKVVIVCAGRIEKQHADMIKQFMKWLQYSKYKKRFCFIYNKSDLLSEGEKTRNLLSMCEMLGADPKDDGYLYDNGKGQKVQVKHTVNLGFPTPPILTDEVEKDVRRLSYLVSADLEDEPRIEISKSSCIIL